MFIGREQEIGFLEEKYNSPGGQLIVLYGRRRIGKTETLCQFCIDKPAVFYSCREMSDSKQYAAYMERMQKAGVPADKYFNAFNNWEAAFKSITELPGGNRKKLLIIDEFPYMCKGNSSIPSVLQILWDEDLKNQNVMIVLCGSSMSFIEKELLSEKNPLYGRATGIYKMSELPFNDAVKFFPDYSDEDKMLAYSILGGVPHYLRQFDPAIPIRENIIRNVLTKGCVLYNEVEFLIRQELREPAFYNTVIEAIAHGNTQLNDIYTKTQLDKAKISVYIKNLIELQLLEREFSVLSSTGSASSGKEQAASTRGLYRITDNFFRFWYSFISPNLSDLETGDTQGVYDYAILPRINHFVSLTYERVCREFIRKKSQHNELPFRIAALGRWWGKWNKEVSDINGKQRMTAIDTEIDIVAVDESSNSYIFGECKYRNSQMDMDDLDKLIDKASITKKGSKVFYALFSKAGFTDKLSERAAADDNTMLFPLSDVVGNSGN